MTMSCAGLELRLRSNLLKSIKAVPHPNSRKTYTSNKIVLGRPLHELSGEITISWKIGLPLTGIADFCETENALVVRRQGFDVL